MYSPWMPFSPSQPTKRSVASGSSRAPASFIGVSRAAITPVSRCFRSAFALDIDLGLHPQDLADPREFFHVIAVDPMDVVGAIRGDEPVRRDAESREGMRPL